MIGSEALCGVILGMVIGALLASGVCYLIVLRRRRIERAIEEMDLP